MDNEKWLVETTRSLKGRMGIFDTAEEYRLYSAVLSSHDVSKEIRRYAISELLSLPCWSLIYTVKFVSGIERVESAMSAVVDVRGAGVSAADWIRIKDRVRVLALDLNPRNGGWASSPGMVASVLVKHVAACFYGGTGKDTLLNLWSWAGNLVCDLNNHIKNPIHRIKLDPLIATDIMLKAVCGCAVVEARIVSTMNLRGGASKDPYSVVPAILEADVTQQFIRDAMGGVEGPATWQLLNIEAFHDERHPVLIALRHKLRDMVRVVPGEVSSARRIADAIREGEFGDETHEVLAKLLGRHIKALDFTGDGSVQARAMAETLDILSEVPDLGHRYNDPEDDDRMDRGVE